MRLYNTICNTIIALWSFRLPISDFRLLIPLLALASLSSCIAPQELTNFNEGDELPSGLVTLPKVPPLIIQIDDLLSIKVLSQNAAAAAPFNLEPTGINNAMALGRDVTSVYDYLVDQNGYIDFPVLGAIKVSGLNIQQTKTKLLELLKPHLNDAIVLIRFTNFKVTLFGEINNPGTYNIIEERLTILEAIGTAGDLTEYANRRNILLIREENGQQSFHRINLHSRNIFQSPNFYLIQNDVIYIEPLTEKVAVVRDQAQRFLPWISVLISLTTLGLTVAR